MFKKYKINFSTETPGLFHSDKMLQVNDVCWLYTEPVDAFLHQSEMVLACTSRIQFGDEIFHTIVYDSNLEKLPKFAQDFFLYHELGHIINGDSTIDEETAKKALQMRAQGYILKMEADADLYAASQIGFRKAKKALKLLAFHSDLPKHSRKEIFFRYCKLLEKGPLGIFA